MEDIEIKKLLHYTWGPFFGSFGKLWEIQRKVIPLVLNHKDLVVSSPAATGKTEAVVAPIMELWIKEGRPEGLYVVYVSPTRALVNDLYKRLYPPLERLDIPIGRRIGDRHEFNLKRPEPILITTPESLDLLIAKYPWVFESVKIVVLDEVHLLHDSYRGDQIKILLKRLSLLNPRIRNFYLLSATIGDPKEIGNYYLPRDFKIIAVSGELEIEYYLFKKESAIESLMKEFREKEIKKALIFTNTREEAEEAVKLFQSPPFKNRVWVHHGSLSKGEREEIEELMHSPGLGICVATSTLEFGIDIGDVDAVILIGPPPDANSLLQRIGRGCRRKKNYMLAYGIYSTNFERLLFYTLFEDAKIGVLPKRTRIFDLSVACQQIFSYLHQKRRIGTSFNAIKRLLYGAVSEEETQRIMETLIEREVVESGRGNLYFLTPKLGRLVEMGKIHSNISDKEEFEVIDYKNNKKIGIIQKVLPQFSLGGKEWKTVSIEEKRIYVVPLQGKVILGKVFSGKGSFCWKWEEWARLKKRLLPEIKENTFPYFNDEGRTFFFHFTGPVYGTLWQKVLNQREREIEIEIEDMGHFLFVSNKILEVKDLGFTYDEIEGEALKLGNQLKYFMDFGAFFNFLAPEMREEMIISHLRLEDFVSYVQGLKTQQIDPILGRKIIGLLMS
jgi:ATP-dependent Lhr-like helicase